MAAVSEKQSLLASTDEKGTWKEHCFSVNFALLPVKLLFFIYIASLSVIRPYLPVFLYDQGLNAFQVGILRCLEPMSGFLISPLWGYAADKFLIHKTLMIICAVGSSLFNPLLIFVPPTTYFLQTVTEEESNWTIVDSAVSDELLPSFSLFTFSLTTVLVIVNSVFVAGFIPLMDSNAMEICKRYPGATYGGQRWLGSLAVILFSPLAGTLVDVYVKVEGYIHSSAYFLHNHYILAFALFTFLGFLSLLPTSAMEVVQRISPKVFSRKILEIVLTFDVIVTFLVIFIIGICRGILTGFLFIFMEEIGASKFTMGLTLVVSCATEVPFLMYSGKMIDTFGHELIFCLGLVAYGIRLLGYSLITTPWQFFPFEALHGICYGLMWANCTEYANRIAPEGMAATLQSVVHAIKAGLGEMLGVVIGGLVYKLYGARCMFAVSSAVVLVISVLYIVNIILFHQRKERNSPDQTSQNDNKHVTYEQ